MSAPVVKPLAQATPNVTTTVQIYSPATGKRAKISGITIAVLLACDIDIFLDIDGSVFDEKSTLFTLKSQAQFSTVSINDPLAMDETSNLAVKTSVIDSATFTVSGWEMDA